MPATYSTTFKNEALNLLLRGNPGSVYAPIGTYNLMAGAQPATPDDTASSGFGNAVATSQRLGLKYSAPVLGVAALGAAITMTNNAGAPRTPSYLRIYRADLGNVALSQPGNIDLPVGVVGSGQPCILSSTAEVAAGGTADIDNLNLTIPLTSGTMKMSVNLVNRFIQNALLGNGNDTLLNTTHFMQMGYDNISGGYPARLKFYSGSPPASADDAPTGTLLATYAIPNGTDLFAAASGGSVALASVPIAVTGSADGTAGYFRLEKTGIGGGTLGNGVIQGTVGTADADLIVSTTAVTNGGSFNMLSLTFTM